MKYLLVGIGGIFGSIARYSLGKYISEHSKSAFPRGTFVINVTGALLLGILTAFENNNNTYFLLGDGFLGAYTTFSTFVYEGFNLFQNEEKLDAFKYILCSLLLGILAFSLGLRTGKLIK